MSTNERVPRLETVFAHFHEKVKLCGRLGLTAVETKSMVYVKLHYRELSSALLSNGHSSEADLGSWCSDVQRSQPKSKRDSRVVIQITTPIKSKSKPASEKGSALTSTKETFNVKTVNRTSSQTSPRC